MHKPQQPKAMTPPKQPLPSDLISQPEHAIGRDGVQKLAKAIGCDPSDILHVKRSRQLPTPNVNSMLD